MTAPAAAQQATLYSFHKSSASWRVRIALNYMRIPYDYAAVHLRSEGGDQHDAAFVALNPSAQVPVLRIDGYDLVESVAIAEYLDETRARAGGRALYPRGDAYARACVRAVVEAINAGIQPKQNLSTLDRVETLVEGGDSGDRAAARREWAAYWNVRGLGAVEQLLRRHAGQFCVGDQLSFADCCLVPQVHASQRYGVDLAQFPTVSRVFAHLETLPHVQAAHADVQPDAA